MSRRDIWFLAAALGVALILATFLSPFASPSPDGLEKVTEANGLRHDAVDRPLWAFAIAPDYAAPGVASETMATALSGFAGVLATFGAGLGLAKWAARRRASATFHEPRRR